MLPDLGKYSFAVLSSYGATFVLLAGIVALTLWRGRSVKARLAQAESRQGGAHHG